MNMEQWCIDDWQGKLTALLDMHNIQDLELTDITSCVFKKNLITTWTVKGACLGNSEILLGKMAHVIMLLTCILEVPALNFSPNINYPERVGFCCFPQSLQPNTSKYTSRSFVLTS
jgi:hypothetical protein